MRKIKTLLCFSSLQDWQEAVKSNNVSLIMDSLAIELTLVADDYDKAINFYCDVLGDFDIISNLSLGVSRLVRLRFGDPSYRFHIGVIRVDTEDYRLRFPSGSGERLSLSLPTSDCIAKFNRLRARGIKTDSAIVYVPWGCGFAFVDPFGNRLTYYEMARDITS